MALQLAFTTNPYDSRVDLTAITIPNALKERDLENPYNKKTARTRRLNLICESKSNQFPRGSERRADLPKFSCLPGLSRSGQSPDFTGCFPPRCHRLYSPLSPDAYQACPSALSRKSETRASGVRPLLARGVMAFFFLQILVTGDGASIIMLNGVATVENRGTPEMSAAID